MKNRKMLDFMGLADDKYINEADPSLPHKRAKSSFKWSTFLAAACCFLLILNIAIMVPLLSQDEPSAIATDSKLDQIQSPTSSNNLIHIPTDSQKPNGSQGGSLDSQKPGSTDSSLNSEENQDGAQNSTPPSSGNQASPDNPTKPLPEQDYSKHTLLLAALDRYFSSNHYNSAFGDLSDKIQDALEQDKVQEETKEESNEANGNSPSTDINDNQVLGIKEGDIAKKSDKHIFYLNNKKLYIYSIKGQASVVECILPLNKYLDDLISYEDSLDSSSLNDKLEKEFYSDDNYAYYEGWEMYLSDDYSTLTIIMIPRNCQMTGIFTFDVSHAPTVELKDFKMFSGTYVTSRVVDDEILLFTKYSVNKSYDKENPLSYVPFYVTKDEEYLVNDLYLPAEINSSTYITVTRLENGGLTVKESSSYLSYSDEIYVSENNIFLTRAFRADLTSNSSGLLDAATPYNTEIAVIGYKSDLFKNMGTVTVKGYVKDQYSLDEYEGILRVATTSYMEPNIYTSTASLFCIDISAMEIVASVERFAPESEIVRSVRFDGTNGYVCTSYQEVLSDPVFFFDLSDLNNITYTDTGVIDGYSSSLINIGGGYVIGIGYGSSRTTLKIEAYKENGDKVESVCIDEYTNTYFATDYKAYYVDRERHLVGLAISSYDSNSKTYKDYYLLLRFNGIYFDSVIMNTVDHEIRNVVRGFYQNKFFYIITDCEFKVIDTGSLDNLFFLPTEEEESQSSGTATPSPAWPSV